MEVDYPRQFIKEFKKCSLKIQYAFRDRLALFLSNSFHDLLHNHPLSGRLKGRRSINITGDWRAIFEETENGVTFVDIGTHSQLYKK